MLNIGMKINQITENKRSTKMTAQEIRDMTDSEIKNAWSIIHNSWNHPENEEDETRTQRRNREWYQDTIYHECKKRGLNNEYIL